MGWIQIQSDMKPLCFAVLLEITGIITIYERYCANVGICKYD